ncbi:MAG: acid-shock protein [Pseudomonadota bacterium]
MTVSNTTNKNLLLVAMAITMALVVAGIAATDASAHDRKGGRGAGTEMRFENLDADKNGQVTFAEFQARMLERFAAADADNDNLVTVAEAEEAIGNRGRGRGGRAAEMIIRVFDIDGDDAVSLEELNNRQAKMFSLADRDDSGFVTEDELPNRRFAAMRRGGNL